MNITILQKGYTLEKKYYQGIWIKTFGNYSLYWPTYKSIILFDYCLLFLSGQMLFSICAVEYNPQGSDCEGASHEIIVGLIHFCESDL